MPTSDMQRVLRVRVAGREAPIAGSYAIRDGVIEFTPAFPLDAGRPYTLELFQDAMPVHRGAGVVALTTALPATDATPLSTRRSCA